jgi:hypothetical protein
LRLFLFLTLSYIYDSFYYSITAWSPLELVSYGERLLQHYSKKENPVTTLAKFNSKIKSYYVYDSCDEENVKLNDEIISLINNDCTIVLGLIGGLINYFLDFKR